MRDAATRARPSRPASIERWHPGQDEAAVLALRAKVWGASHPHTRPDFLNWLLGSCNPAGPGGGALVRRAGEVVGFAAIWPRAGRVCGHDVTVAQGVDYMVDPDLAAAASGRYALRLADAWTQLARDRNFFFGFSFPNRNSIRIQTSRHLCWREVLHPCLMVRPLRGHAAGRGLGAAAVRVGFGVCATILGAAGRLRTGAVEGAARPIDLGDPTDAATVDELWTRRRDDVSVSLRRDAVSLRWRYELHPVRRYRLLGWENPDGLAALVVTTRRELAGIPSVLIVDAMVDGHSLASARALIAAALGDALANGACLAAAEAVPGTALYRALAGAGFVVVPRRFDPKPFTMVVLPFAGGSDVALSPAGWNFAWGDMTSSDRSAMGRRRAAPSVPRRSRRTVHPPDLVKFFGRAPSGRA